MRNGVVRRGQHASKGSVVRTNVVPLDDGCGQLSIRDAARPFDVGGEESWSGDLNTSPKPMARWELETHALFLSLVKKRMMKVDELRAGVERLDPQRYHAWSYYDKWASSMAHAALARGLVEEDDLNAALGEVSTPLEPLFKAGAIVRVKLDERPLAKHRKPHVRVPAYVHGAVGVVEAYRGAFEDPEFLAFRGSSEAIPLYTIRFSSAALGWGKDDVSICAEVYQSWLESAQEKDLQEANNSADDLMTNTHEEHDHDHEHWSRYETEKRAVEGEAPETPGERLTAALLLTLEAKGHLDLQEFRMMVEVVENMSAPTKPEAIGPRLVARAWKNPDFKKRLLADAQKALEDDFQFQATNSTAHTKLVAVANEPGKIHHLTVCTLCSCYPLTIIGLSPSWYKDVKYRARAVRQPRKLLRDSFGLHLPDDLSVKVLDSTADCRYIVIPEPPANLHDLDEAQLAQLVTRDSMIGVAKITSQ